MSKNTETDIGVQAEDQKSKAVKPLEILPLPRLRQTKGQSCNAPYSTKFLSLPLYIPLFAQSYQSCLYLPSAGTKLKTCDPSTWDHLCVSCFPFLDRFNLV